MDRGVRVSFQSPWINHLLFVDDSLIFMSAKVASAERMNEILQIYSECSGQCVNKEKSSIYFSPYTIIPVRQSMKQTLGTTSEAFNERYLGLPTAVGHISSANCAFIIKFKVSRESFLLLVERFFLRRSFRLYPPLASAILSLPRICARF